MTFAMVECSDGKWRPAMGGKRWIDDSLVWVFSDGKYRDRDDSNSRLLVVIDPEDREAVERLHALYEDLGRGTDVPDMRDALREYANRKPPKPDEPTGLYARVEDAAGRIWVRTALQASVWRRESVNSGGFRYLIPQDGCEDYADITAVKVLSPGVTE